jgi:hypothetical protein|tara:strand:+ start:482 stop:1054 length:573 start_codon:yes stop_codon:yes gene_type:complete
MSKESVLKKEFQEKDVQRLRNLMTGKHGDRTIIGVGYTKVEEFHKEGDIWETDGRKWTIKDGIKQNITKLDEAKKAINMPLFCPSCNTLMKKHADKRFYLQFKRCLTCQVDFEAELKLEGLWEEYNNVFINDNIDNTIKEFENWFEESLNSSNEDFITEAGDVESWVGSNKAKMLENKEETLKFLQSLKK